MKYRTKSIYNFGLDDFVVDAIKVQKGMDIDAPQWFLDAIETKRLEIRDISKITRDMPFIRIMVGGYYDGWVKNNDWLVMFNNTIHGYLDGMFELMFEEIE